MGPVICCRASRQNVSRLKPSKSWRHHGRLWSYLQFILVLQIYNHAFAEMFPVYILGETAVSAERLATQSMCRYFESVVLCNERNSVKVILSIEMTNRNDYNIYSSHNLIVAWVDTKVKEEYEEISITLSKQKAKRLQRSKRKLPNSGRWDWKIPDHGIT